MRVTFKLVFRFSNEFGPKTVPGGAGGGGGGKGTVGPEAGVTLTDLVRLTETAPARSSVPAEVVGPVDKGPPPAVVDGLSVPPGVEGSSKRFKGIGGDVSVALMELFPGLRE